MASSCNQRTPQHRHDHGEDHDHHRHRRRSSSSNRFNSSRMMHFHNNTQTLAALVMFLVVLLMSHHQVVSEETLAPEPTSTMEFEFFGQPTTPITEKTINETAETEDHKVLSELSLDIQQADVNNDIFSTMVEVSHAIKIAPDFIDSQPGVRTAESTDNLEQSIRNSVKNEMEQNLESSPVLEILKDIAEPEIRQTLTEDLIESTVNQNDLTPKPEEDTEAKAQEIEIVGDQSQVEPEKPVEVIDESEVFEAQLDGTRAESQNTRGARNLEIDISNTSRNKTSESSSSSSSSESNSSENSQESHDKDKADVSPEEEGGETELIDEPQKPSAKLYDESVTRTTEQENNRDTDDKHDQPEADLTIAETSDEFHTDTTTPTSDIAFLGVEEHLEPNEDEALSVVLDESLSSTVPNSDEETLMTMEQANEQTSLDRIAAEEEEATVIPDESEHVVIKKVLDVKEIFDDVAETTVVPEVARDLAIENQPTVVAEVPTPTIIVEEVSVTEHDTVQHSVEDSHQKPTDVLMAEEQSPVVTNNDVVLNKQKEELVNEKGVEPVANEEETSVTINPENTFTDETNTQGTNPPESQTEKIEQEANVEEAVHSVNTVVIKEEPTINNIEDDERVKVLEPQHHEHINSQVGSSTTESDYDIASESPQNPTEEPSNDFHFASTTAAASDLEAATENHEMSDEIAKKGSRSVNRALIDDDAAATMFEAYPPQDAGQTFNGNLADESLGIGKALPVSTNDVSNRSTIIIILSSGTAFLFIVISVTIFLISFQRQHGTLDIEMQERSCGKDNLDEEDAETFAKLLEVELPPSVAIALEETEECL